MKYFAIANKIASDYYGLVEGEEYALEKSNGLWWLVYNKFGTYITAARTDCFDNYRLTEDNFK